MKTAIRRALISVYDKTGIADFARDLVENGVEIVSTGGTYKLLRSEGLDVRAVEDITEFPEMLDGRVKTLHPRIFGALLADLENPAHDASIREMGIDPIGLAVVNLYPFEATVAAPGATLEDAVEQIDIGGVSLIRAASKNFKNVCIVTSPRQYEEFLEEFRTSSGMMSEKYCRMLASEAFAVTSRYDRAISSYLSDGQGIRSFAQEKFPGREQKSLRYGENPHQQALLVSEGFDGVYSVLHGKEISYNNLLDMNAAYDLISDLDRFGPACAIIKHGNPCGAASAADLKEAYLKAFATDTVSPFGGIIVFNRKLDFNTSEEIDKLFAEIIMAPDFDDDAFRLLSKKKNRRLVRFSMSVHDFEFRSIAGGVLVQERDRKHADTEILNFVTKRQASENEIADLIFAEAIAKHVKSNAVVFAKGMQTLAIGAGQPSRIDSTKIAVAKAVQFGLDLKGSSAASDAFFPFSDGVTEIANAGATSVIQPGGSVRDAEVIQEADAKGMAMAFTGVRHFKH